MANPNPSPTTRFAANPEALAAKPFCIRLPADIDPQIRAMGPEWVRQALRNALENALKLAPEPTDSD